MPWICLKSKIGHSTFIIRATQKHCSRPQLLHPQGLSNGSDALLVNPPPVFAGPATGVCVVEAEVQPPKSSSAVTVIAWAGLLDDEIGEPHPPEMSLGVILDGT